MEFNESEKLNRLYSSENWKGLTITNEDIPKPNVRRLE